MGEGRDDPPTGSGGCNPVGCLLLLFVVLLLAALPTLLEGLGAVLALCLVVVVAAVLHGTVQGKGGWGAVLRGTWRSLLGLVRKED